MTEWQPIEKAPKDGGDILVCTDSETFFCDVVSYVGWANYGKGGWWNGDVATPLDHYDFWMPFPEPPRDDASPA